MLLHFVRLPGAAKGVPLLVEIPVHEASAPYLVTSNKGLLWIDRSFNGIVRSAMLATDWKGTLDQVAVEVIQAIRKRGLEQSWGNTFSFTAAGLAGARDYLHSYGLDAVELLVPAVSGYQDEVVCPFTPAGCAVLIPKDRAYLGIVGVLGSSNDRYTVVVHNPARGMAVLGDW